jgi:hypothetical protein
MPSSIAALLKRIDNQERCYVRNLANRQAAN